MKNNSKERLFEIMERVVPNFNINEEIGGAASANPNNTQQEISQLPTTPEHTQQLDNKGKDFPEAFRTWITSLGYKPTNTAISILKVKTEIERVMKDMGYR